MKFLQIGIGSMGKRRLRCFEKLGFKKNVAAFDISKERRMEAKEKYGVAAIDCLDNVNFSEIDAIIISTPPDKHDEYIKLAIEKKRPAFVEASVVIGELQNLEKEARKSNVLIAPSCTMRFHPAIKDIIDIVRTGVYGKVTNFTYHCGQYLPDWHPYEDIKSFYVSKKETGAAREIVPFEMTWLVELTGLPERVAGFKGKTMDMGINIDDTYVIAMEFKKNAYGVINIDAVSRYATRNLILNLEYAQVLWRWDENAVKVYDVKKGGWASRAYQAGQAEKGYNKNIREDMYVDELAAFIKAVKNKSKFQNSLKDDIALLKMVEEVEEFSNAK